MSKNLFVRKIQAFGKKPARFLKRIGASSDDYARFPPVLGNSFPKSGTHLLLQILQRLPGTVSYGSFIASRNSSVILRERSAGSHARLINAVVPGEVVPAHLFCSGYIKDELAKKNFVHYFIYRDPRDCIASEVNYIMHLNRWHRLHGYMSSLNSAEERVSAIINASWESSVKCDYPNIARRFIRYHGWIDDPDVFPIRFEDLISDRRTSILQDIVTFYVKKSGIAIDTGATLQSIKNNLVPEKSHTFWKGQTGAWRESFTERNKDEFKSVAGALLIKLGYEKDLDW